MLRLCRGQHKRKNYLFCGSDAGGERAAAIYSPIGTAKLNGIDPEAYLRYVLERIADTRSTASMNCFPGLSANCATPKNHSPPEAPRQDGSRQTLTLLRS